MDAIPDTEEEAEQKAKELVKDARETKQQLDQKQATALEKISEGDDFEKYDTVTLGSLNMEVKAWLPGEIEEEFQTIQTLENDPEAVDEARDAFFRALTKITEGEDYTREFWRAYYEKWGQRGLIKAADTLMQPAIEDLEETQEGLDSFHGDGSRDGFRDDVQYARDASAGGDESPEA